MVRAASPAESIASVATSTAGAKRKERDFDPDDGEATNINVVVRCRGRNEREVKENSAVVVRTEATKGKVVQLSMGPNAVSDKTYHFDRVFSQAADQSMIFEDVVKPVLDEVTLTPPVPPFFMDFLKAFYFFSFFFLFIIYYIFFFIFIFFLHILGRADSADSEKCG